MKMTSKLAAGVAALTIGIGGGFASAAGAAEKQPVAGSSASASVAEPATTYKANSFLNAQYYGQTPDGRWSYYYDYGQSIWYVTSYLQLDFPTYRWFPGYGWYYIGDGYGSALTSGF